MLASISCRSYAACAEICAVCDAYAITALNPVRPQRPPATRLLGSGTTPPTAQTRKRFDRIACRRNGDSDRSQYRAEPSIDFVSSNGTGPTDCRHISGISNIAVTFGNIGVVVDGAGHMLPGRRRRCRRSCRTARCDNPGLKKLPANSASTSMSIWKSERLCPGEPPPFRKLTTSVSPPSSPRTNVKCDAGVSLPSLAKHIHHVTNCRNETASSPIVILNWVIGAVGRIRSSGK